MDLLPLASNENDLAANALGQAVRLQHARERARLERLGRTPAFVDGTIAAIAVMNDLPLATRNLDDFRDFEGLRVENWFV